LSHLTYAQTIITGFIQGVTELFPISSLGHNVLIPAVIGGSWAKNLNVSSPDYLAFIVGLHVATAIAMIIYFWRDWIRIIGGFFTSLRDRRLETPSQRLAWMIIIGTIPVGIVGVVAQHAFQQVFAKAVVAAWLLMANGVILFAVERLRGRASQQAEAQLADEPEYAGQRGYAGERGYAAERAYGGEQAHGGERGYPGEREFGGERGYGGERAYPGERGYGGERGYPGEREFGGQEAYGRVPPPEQRVAGRHASGHQAARREEYTQAVQADVRLARAGLLNALLIGATQILALLAGISRDGIVMAGGMFRGLSRQDAARFSFLLSAPVILAAGVLKAKDLTGASAQGMHMEILVGSIVAGVSAYLTLRFLVRYLQTRTLTPFAIYCVLAGLASAIYLTIK
jgi:undecaprenyl-diphosphatase